MHSDSSKLVSFPLISSLFSLWCIYSFVYLVIVELLSDTNALIQRKTLKISQKTDSRTQNRAKLAKTREWKENEKQRTMFVLMQNGPVLGCVRSTACRQGECVFGWMCACMLAVLRSNQAKRKSLSMCRQRICLLSLSRGAETHVQGGLFDTLTIRLSFKYHQCFLFFFLKFQEEMKIVGNQAR